MKEIVWETVLGFQARKDLTRPKQITLELNEMVFAGGQGRQ